MRLMRLLFVLILTISPVLGGCSDDDTVNPDATNMEAGVEAGAVEAGTEGGVEAGSDGGDVVDSAVSDSGVSDAGAVDSVSVGDASQE